MLASQNRLRRPQDINRVYGRGRSGFSPQLTVKAFASRMPESRVAVVVSKKVSKKAVTRNRIRRRITAELRNMWQTVSPGYDIVVSVRVDISKLPPAELKAQLIRALTKSGAAVGR